MIGAVILAAGRSSRMGTQKLLLPWGESCMIRHIAQEVIVAAIDQVVVVIAPDPVAAPERPATCRDALQGLDVRFAVNEDPDADMLSSVRCGLRMLRGELSAAMVVLGDQPGVDRELVRRLIAASRNEMKSIVVPVYEGRRGHPILFSMSLVSEVLSSFDGVGLRGLLDAHPSDVLEVPAESAEALMDIDVPEDYQRQQR